MEIAAPVSADAHSIRDRVFAEECSAVDRVNGSAVTSPRRYVSAEQIEDVVRQLRDVVSARVVLDALGRVDELHVLVNPRRAPKQVARDIESGLHAHLGIEVDYKKISIAQIQGRSALAGSAAERARLRFCDVSLTVSGAKAEATVHLKRDETMHTGTAIGHASNHNQLRLIANAALRAVENTGSEDGTMVIEDVASQVSLAGRTAIVLLVSAIGSAKGEELMTGSALVRQDVWKAVVNATLDAVNRRLSMSWIDEELS
jgi:hypothetical protein